MRFRRSGQSMVGVIIASGLAVGGMVFLAQSMLTTQKLGQGIQASGDVGLALDNLRAALASPQNCRESFVTGTQATGWAPADRATNPASQVAAVDKIVLRDGAGAEAFVVLQKNAKVGAATIQDIEIRGTGVKPISRGSGPSLTYYYPVELRVVALRPEGSPGVRQIERRILLYAGVPQASGDPKNGRITTCTGPQGSLAGTGDGSGLAGFNCGPPVGQPAPTANEFWVVSGFDDGGLPKCVKVTRPTPVCQCCAGASANDLPGSITIDRSGSPMHYCRKGGCNTSSYHTKNCRYWRSDGSYAAGYISTDTGLKGTSCQVNGDDAGVYGAYVANCNDGTGFITTSLEWVE